MKRVLSSIAVLSAVIMLTGATVASEEFPNQEATVTITVSTPEGEILQEDTLTDTTQGADTTAQYQKLQKNQSAEQPATANQESQ